ncbi:uncharacterized protein TRIVIDRAFT_147343 [Trichoderma virens Gv29-8]|uniref:CHCH domain-containing protein n=1 Tax=Hypocrea virens (strain Gv29-8 / FGSC 10586) TaxID=413071 RepID=G9MNZ7_HYPVG|nr:uncharacterized protein TRIVIDRAFT_147343 [Trichoderma virens Gv29-8]EHK23599.1 hypothetical protein TRIVIDRAFT_147343 [Trichoderma virens Gv29-8]
MPGQVQEKPPATGASAAAIEDDDEPDEWDKRIFSTGCADENAKMTDCYYEKKDWRACAKEARNHLKPLFTIISKCWKQHGNNERTSTKDT